MMAQQTSTASSVSATPGDRVLDATSVAWGGGRPAFRFRPRMVSSDVTSAPSDVPDETTEALRVVVAEDDALLREGIASLRR